MRVFVTGGTGFVGTAVINELLAHNHTVVALVRSDKAAASLEARGVETIIGSIEDADALRRGASSNVDAALHLAFIHDFTNFAHGCAVDRAAIATLGDTLIASGGGEGKALVATSGTLMLEAGGLGDEDSPIDPSNPLAAARGAAEKVCLDYAGKGLRASVVRLPPTTHGPGSSGFTGLYAQTSLAKGAAVYVGDGDNTWAAGHRDDAAKLYRLAAEKGVAGSVYHASVEEGVKVRDIASAVGESLGVPVKSITPDEVEGYFGHMGFIVLANNLASSKKTQDSLGWTPSAPLLIENVPTIVEHVRSEPSAH